MPLIRQNYGAINKAVIEYDFDTRENIAVNTPQIFYDVVSGYGIITSYTWHGLIGEFVIQDGVLTILYSSTKNSNVNTISLDGTTLTLNSSNGEQLGNVSYRVFKISS